MQIEDLTTWAKEFMLKDGKHAPTLFVETDKPEMVIAGLADMPGTPDARLLYFLALGRRFAGERPGERVREVAFIAMSWASKQQVGKPAPKVRPSQDPNRMELLLISHVKLNADDSVAQDGRMVEILRDGKGKVRDLLQMPGNVEDGQSPMLILFILGFQNPTLSDQEILRIMQDMRGPA